MSIFSDYKRATDRIYKLSEQKDITWLQLIKGCAKAVHEEVGKPRANEDKQQENEHELRK